MSGVADDELVGLMERLKDLNTSLPPFGELGSFLTEKVATDEDKRATLVKEINKDIHEKVKSFRLHTSKLIENNLGCTETSRTLASRGRKFSLR